MLSSVDPRHLRFHRRREKVTFDLLVDSVFDRETRIAFEGALFTEYSKERITVGRPPGKIGLIRSTVMSMSYRNSLQASYGKIPDKTFKNCTRNLVKFLDGLM